MVDDHYCGNDIVYIVKVLWLREHTKRQDLYSEINEVNIPFFFFINLMWMRTGANMTKKKKERKKSSIKSSPYDCRLLSIYSGDINQLYYNIYNSLSDIPVKNFLDPILHLSKNTSAQLTPLASHSCQNKFKTLFPFYNAANTLDLYCPQGIIKPYSLWPFLMGLCGRT